MKIIKNQKELSDYLDYCSLRPGENFTEECFRAWEKEREEQGYSGYSVDDDRILLNAKGKWFDKDICIPLYLYGANPLSYMCFTKIRPEDKQAVMDTISYIQEHFDQIYEAMLNCLFPYVRDWKMQNKNTGELVETIQHLHKAREIRVKDGMETECFNMLQLNCEYQKEGIVVCSMGFMPDCTVYGYDDGFEIVFWKDHIVSFTDGNTMEHIFDFEKYKNQCLYFGW